MLGLALFLVLGLFLQGPQPGAEEPLAHGGRRHRLLGITLVIGNSKYGAVNWISIGGMSFQPSEIAKICYIFAGARHTGAAVPQAEPDPLHRVTGVCIGLLGLMSDFAAAAIFFVTFW